MNNINRTPRTALRAAVFLALALTVSACAGSKDLSQSNQMNFASAKTEPQIDPERHAFAVAVANQLRAQNKRVWCVPFARNASGIAIQGNAGTWWGKAAGKYDRAKTPKVGAVMAFTSTRKLPMGHVAVVSEIVSDREIKIDHANWSRNKISLGMTVVDVSKANDWSQVRVESQANQLGRVYPVSGFIAKHT
jgi:surface antigen